MKTKYYKMNGLRPTSFGRSSVISPHVLRVSAQIERLHRWARWRQDVRTFMWGGVVGLLCLGVWWRDHYVEATWAHRYATYLAVKRGLDAAKEIDSPREPHSLTYTPEEMEAQIAKHLGPPSQNTSHGEPDDYGPVWQKHCDNVMNGKKAATIDELRAACGGEPWLPSAPESEAPIDRPIIAMASD